MSVFAKEYELHGQYCMSLAISQPQESMPLVTVLIASYNHEAFVEACILSVINQTYRNIQLIRQEIPRLNRGGFLSN